MINQPTRRDGRGAAGYALTEVLLVIVVIGILSAIGFPLYVSYSRAQETDGAARALVVTLHQARQLAITRGMSYTVETQTNPNNRTRFFCTNTTLDINGATLCTAGTVWTGPGTDASGWRRLENASRIVLGPTIVFSSLGAATTAGVLRVQNSSATGTLDVCVSPSGRIRVQATGTACP